MFCCLRELFCFLNRTVLFIQCARFVQLFAAAYQTSLEHPKENNRPRRGASIDIADPVSDVSPPKMMKQTWCFLLTFLRCQLTPGGY